MKIKVKNIKNIGFVALFTFMLFLTQTRLGTADYKLLRTVYIVIVFAFCTWFSVEYRGFLKIKKYELYEYMLLLLPYFLLMIWSVLLAAMLGGITVKRAILESSTQIIMGTAAFCAVRFNSKKIVDWIFYAAVINYSVYLFVFTMQFGLDGLLHFISYNDERIGVTRLLEVHEVTFIFGLLVTYYLLHNQKRTHNRKILVCLIYILFGYKRILFGALAVTYLLYLICYKKSNLIRTNILMVSVFGICVFWLFFTTSQYYELVAEMLGVELNGRNFSKGMYSLLNGYYTMLPLYLGHGVGFTHNVMMQAQAQGRIATSGFHNDILKYYIDIGFIPWFLFFGNMTMLIPQNIRKKFTLKSANQYLLYLCITLICWATDNLATYPNYLFALFTVWILTMEEGYKERMMLRHISG